MQVLFPLLVFIALLLFAVFIRMKEFTVRKQHTFQYRVVNSVFDKREAVFFQELKRQLPEGYYIFPKIRLADVMETTATDREYIGQVNRILKKHVDFLICDQSYKPVLAIELNGSSHKTARAKKSDDFKQKAFENIGLRLEVIRVGSDFSQEVTGLIELLNNIHISE